MWFKRRRFGDLIRIVGDHRRLDRPHNRRPGLFRYHTFTVRFARNLETLVWRMPNIRAKMLLRICCFRVALNLTAKHCIKLLAMQACFNYHHVAFQTTVSIQSDPKPCVGHQNSFTGRHLRGHGQGHPSSTLCSRHDSGWSISSLKRRLLRGIVYSSSYFPTTVGVRQGCS